jgi:predicted ATPase
MPLKQISLENFTVFDKLNMEFCDGINVFIGENATGKTHIMKLLYSACQAAQVEKTAIDFPQKIARVFRPDDFNIGHLVSRKKGNERASVLVSSDKYIISVSFDRKTKRWNANVPGDRNWEKQNKNLMSTFIPAKEILSNSRNLVNAIDKGNVDFDDTYKDIITAANVNLNKGPQTEKTSKYLASLQKISRGRVMIDNDEFYLLPPNQSKMEFQLVGEGLRKIALLWQLIKNGTLEKGSILFWDEPEANINPKHIPALVEILASLQDDGVQIFIATHDYILAKYIELKIVGTSCMRFHSFYKGDEGIAVESNQLFKNLQNNPIAEAYDKLLDEVFRVN